MRELIEQRFWRIATLVMLIQAVLLISTAFGEWATWDEGTHLVSGFSYWKTGDYRLGLEHPPLGKMLNALPLLFRDVVLPVESPYWKKGDDANLARPFLYHNHIPWQQILMPARMMTVALTLVFSYWIAYWTRSRFGAPAALLALILFAFDPNFLAHGKYVTTDLIGSFTSFLALTLWIECWEQPSRKRFLVAGIAVGLALSAKFSTVFLLPVIAVIGAWKWREKQWPVSDVLRGVGLSIAAAVVAILLAYAPALRWGIHQPFVLLVGGADLLRRTTNGHPSYLLGQVSKYGWWYYFPVAFAVKTPATTLAIFATALSIGLWKRRRVDFAIAALLGAALLYFGLSLKSGFYVGVRHLMPMYVPLFVAASVAIVRVRPPQVLVVFIALLVLESMSIYPHYLAFFNKPSGGPMAGTRYLLDSNLDWGQDLLKLARFLKERQIPYACVSLFTNSAPQDYPFKFDGVPLNAGEDVWRTADCLVAVSATELYGVYGKPDQFLWLRQRKEDERIGYSIFVYDLRKGAGR